MQRLAPGLDAAPADPGAAIVVLGCRAALGEGDRLAPGALARRVDAAVRLHDAWATDGTIVIASGGRRWGDVVEADAMARELRLRGVGEARIVRERCSLSTRDNARFVAEALARRGVRGAIVVTCAWHMPRALALFARAGIDARPFPAAGGRPPPRRTRLWLWAREGFLARVQRLSAASARPLPRKGHAPS